MKDLVKNRQFWCIVVMAFLFALSWTMPYCLNNVSVAKCLMLAIPFTVLFVLFFTLVLLICKATREHVAVLKDSSRIKRIHQFFDNLDCKIKGKGLFLTVLITLLILWGIVFLICYPGCCSVDTNDIFRMALGLPFESNHFRYDTLNNHHPVFYVFLNYVVLTVGQTVGLPQAISVALITLIHLLILTVCCSYFSVKLRELFSSDFVFVIAWIFFALNPVIAQYSVTIWKDIIFSGLFLVFIIQYAFLILKPAESASNKKFIIGFILVSICCSLLRNNAFAIILVSIALLLCVKSIRKAALVALASIALLFILVTGPLYNMIGVQPTHFSESMSVPIQQVGRVVVENGSITEDQKDFLNSILPYEQWAERYRPASPNNIKFATDFNDDFLEANKTEFIKTWMQIGIQNPGVYFRAWCAQTLSFWSMTGETWYEAAPGYSIDPSQPPRVHNLTHGLISYEDFSLYRVASIKAFGPLYNVAGLVWFALITFMVLLCGKNSRRALVLIPLGLLWATFLVATPASDYRYVFVFLLAVPLFISICLFGFKDSSSADRILRSANQAAN